MSNRIIFYLGPGLFSPPASYIPCIWQVGP